MINNTKIKFCGIRTIEVAQSELLNQADFIGLNFVTSSRRCITLKFAVEITRYLLKNGPKIVGVFQNPSYATVREVLDLVPLNYLQFHGEESAEFCSQFDLPVIKKIQLEPKNTLDKILAKITPYKMADTILLEPVYAQENQTLDFAHLHKISRRYRIMIAGGLTPANVGEAITCIRPYAIDVARGIEEKNAISLGKIRDFLDSIRKTEI